MITRRTLLKWLGLAPLVAVAPALALQKTSPKSMPIPETAAELYAAMNRIFIKYPVDSTWTLDIGYKKFANRKYYHFTHRLELPEIGLEKELCRSMWEIALIQYKNTVNPMIVWRRKPTYSDAQDFEGRSPSVLVARWSIIEDRLV